MVAAQGTSRSLAHAVPQPCPCQPARAALPAAGTRQGRRSHKHQGWSRLFAAGSAVSPRAVLRHPCLSGTSRQRGRLQAAPGTPGPPAPRGTVRGTEPLSPLRSGRGHGATGGPAPRARPQPLRKAGIPPAAVTAAAVLGPAPLQQATLCAGAAARGCQTARPLSCAGEPPRRPAGWAVRGAAPTPPRGGSWGPSVLGVCLDCGGDGNSTGRLWVQNGAMAVFLAAGTAP